MFVQLFETEKDFYFAPWYGMIVIKEVWVSQRFQALFGGQRIHLAPDILLEGQGAPQDLFQPLHGLKRHCVENVGLLACQGWHCG